MEHTLSYVATHAQAEQQQAIVHQLQRQNAQLTREQKSLNDPATIVRRPGRWAWCAPASSRT